MTKLLQDALEVIQGLSPDRQNEIAQAMLYLAGQEPEDVEPADLPALMTSLEQANRGEFATDVEVETVFRQFGS